MSLQSDIKADFRRYRAEGMRSDLHVILFCQGFWASYVYRVTRRLMQVVTMPGLRSIVGISCGIARTWTEMVTGIALPLEVEIGPGVCIFHFGPTVVNGSARIGSNCNLRHGVTIGVAGRGERRGAPIIGDRVDIGANAILIGKITIGNDVAIGAGAIVTKSVPDRGVVAGNPARLLSLNGSFDFLNYDGMENDPERQASLDAWDAARSEAPTPVMV